MYWQYRTVVFEFHKDGLLGNKFIDDEEMEESLNDLGRLGWELVSTTMVQDGLLTLLKRPENAERNDSLSGGVEQRLVPIVEPVFEKEKFAKKTSEKEKKIFEKNTLAESVAVEKKPGEEGAGIKGWSAEELQEQERQHIQSLGDQRRQSTEQEEPFLLGDIKIN